MAEIYKGRRFSTREEDGLPPISPEEMARNLEILAEFRRKRDAVPESERIHLSNRFGDDDFNDDDFNPDGTRKGRGLA